jgi:hypothetical protein
VGTGANTVVVDTKTYVLGDIFVLMEDATPVIGSGLSLNETGRFAYTPDFLPADLYEEFMPSSFGIDSLTFPDSSYFVTYQLFTTLLTAGAGKPDGTYIVMGTSGTTTISGVVYNFGEVFTQGSTFTFTGNSIAEYYTEETYSFPLYYFAWQAIKNLTLEVANCTCNPELEQRLMEVNGRMESIRINFQNSLNSNYSGTQALLSQIIEIV